MMKKIQAFTVLFSATIFISHLLSTTASARGCFHSHDPSELPSLSQPFSGCDSFGETNFLESREATMAGAAVMAGLFGLNALFRQYKAKQSASEAPADAVVDEPETTVETAEAPEAELEKSSDNDEEAVAEVEPVSTEASEEVTPSTETEDTEETEEAVAVIQ